MSAREQLARVIVTAYGEDGNEECPCVQDFDVADMILADGWVKPRTVNSASELDDLAEGSVIRTAQGAVYEKSGALWVVSPIHFGKASHYAKFPATVLFDSGDVS